MTRHGLCRFSIVLCALACLVPLACQEVKLPDTLKIALEDGVFMNAALNTGPESMKNSIWAIYEPREPHDDGRAREPKFIARVEFGPNGEVLRAFDNEEFGNEHIGDEIVTTNAPQPVPFPAGSYTAASYGGERGDHVAFVALGNFYIGGAYAAWVRLQTSGTLNEAKNRFEGNVTYTIEVAEQWQHVLRDLVEPKVEELAVFAIRETQGT